MRLTVLAKNVPPEERLTRLQNFPQTCHFSSVECQGKRYISCRTLEGGAELVEDDWIVQLPAYHQLAACLGQDLDDSSRSNSHNGQSLISRPNGSQPGWAEWGLPWAFCLLSAWPSCRQALAWHAFGRICWSWTSVSFSFWDNDLGLWSYFRLLITLFRGRSHLSLEHEAEISSEAAKLFFYRGMQKKGFESRAVEKS